MNNIFIEPQLVSDLNINNNCLINKININKRVLICSYENNKIVSSNYSSSCSIVNKNLNNIIIFSYINILTDEFYKFRVMNGTESYPGNCRFYLNNYNTLILNKVDSNNETAYNIIKKGIYLICIDIPKNNNITSQISFTLEFDQKPINNIHPDKLIPTNWQPIDNLLIENCTNVLTNDNLSLVNLFFNNSNNYCTLNNNINTEECKNYNNNISNILSNVYNLKINSTVYPNPIDGLYDPWSIDDNNWNSDLSNNKEIYGSCGNNTSRTRNRKYYKPLYGGNSMEEKPHTTDTQIKNIKCFNDEWTRNEWTKLGATTSQIPSKIIEAQFNTDETIIRNELNKFNKLSLYNNLKQYSNNTSLSTSHNDWVDKEVSSFELTGNDQTSLKLSINNIIFSNILFSNGYTWKSEGDESLTIVMQTDGNLVCIKNKLIIWASNTSGNNNAKLCVTRKGQLIIYSSTKQILWSYDDNGKVFIPHSRLVYEFWNGNITAIDNQTKKFFYGENKKRLYPNLFYSNGYEIRNGNYKAVMQTDGNFVIYNSNNLEWDSQTFNNNAFLGMHTNGNLVIYRNRDIKSSMWSSNTSGNDGSYLELTNIGCLAIKNKENKIIKLYLNAIKNAKIRDYVKSTHWNNSPWIIMMDYIGRCWRVEEWAFGGFFNTNNQQFDRSKSWTKSGTMDNFNGWTHKSNNSFWTGNGISKRLNLKSINGYNNQLNDDMPSRDNDGTVYWRNEDIDNFDTSRRRSSITEKLPKEINENNSNLPVELPGYYIISTKDSGRTLSGVIKCDRGSSKNNTGFLVFTKHTNKDIYADNIISQHPKLIYDIILNLSTDITNNIITNEYVSKFTNKSYFLDKEFCDITQIFKNENCKGIEYDQYKNYLNVMNDYCDKNIWDPVCNTFLSKEFLDINNNIIKADIDNKTKLLNKQERICATDINNILTDKCIDLNKNNPETLKIISKNIDIIKECKNNKIINCKKICTEYPDEFKYSCFWINNQLYIILLSIFIILFGSILVYKRVKNTKKIIKTL